jgi:hypothetical protein
MYKERAYVKGHFGYIDSAKTYVMLNILAILSPKKPTVMLNILAMLIL